jgi:hypothetical protein
MEKITLNIPKDIRTIMDAYVYTWMETHIIPFTTTPMIVPTLAFLEHLKGRGKKRRVESSRYLATLS